MDSRYGSLALWRVTAPRSVPQESGPVGCQYEFLKKRRLAEWIISWLWPKTASHNTTPVSPDGVWKSWGVCRIRLWGATFHSMCTTYLADKSIYPIVCQDCASMGISSSPLSQVKRNPGSNYTSWIVEQWCTFASVALLIIEDPVIHN